MLGLVLRCRVKIWLRSLRSRSGRLRAGPGLSAAVYVLVALGIAAYAGVISVGVHQTNPASEAGLLYVPLAGIVFMTLLGGISVALNELYVSSDVELLLTTPLPDGNLYLLKLLDSSLLAWPTVGWWGSAIAGYGIALGLGWGFLLVGLLAAVLLAAMLVGADIVIVLLLARLVPPRRLREGVILTSSLIGVSAWIAWIASGGRTGRSTISDSLSSLDRRLAWTPIGWAHAALTHAQTGDVALTALGLLPLLLLAAVFAICGYALFARLYLASWSATQESPAGARHRTRQLRADAGSRSAAFSISVKDWRSLKRDVPYLSSLLPTLIYALVYPFLLLRIGGGGSLAARWLGIAGLPLVPLMSASTLGLTAIAREGKAFEVLRASPVSAVRVLAGKVVTVWIPIGLITVVAGLGLAWYHHAPAAAFVVAGVGGAWFALGFSA
ncbi:MAG: putative ABC transporter permease subunit, partial [Dehalococcoidia bacterium]